MSEPVKSSGIGIVWPSVLLAVITSTTIFALRPPLESARPQLTTSADITELPTVNGVFSTFARPWEDPLAAARDHYQKKQRPCPCLPDLQDLLSNFVAMFDRVIVMPVWLRGGPYDDDKEQRLRTRFAVESALAAEEFSLSYPERMSYTILEVPIQFRPAGALQNQNEKVIVPLKLYTQGDKSKAAAVVLWLSESDLGDTPLHATANIVQQLFKKAKPPDPDFSKMEIAVIGPTSSDVHRKIAEPDQCVEDIFPCSKAAVYSSRATSYKREDCWASSYPILSTIGTDRQLLEQLQVELALRTAWIRPTCANPTPAANDKRHIILITEHDTLYGREFPKMVEKVFQMKEDKNLHVFRYLRGIDGQVPRQSLPAKPAERGKDDDAKKSPSASKEVPTTGQAQLDYLQRLERQISDVFLAQRDGHEVIAIGVVSTDVYDRLLVLRALRKNFPGTLFFTTDLDSEFSRPSEYATTRNLIVVSHFGLELRPDLKSPAFRESYQTATFLACRYALSGPQGAVREELTDPEQPNAIKEIPALVFEIGRKGPYQLTEVPGSVHPRRRHPGWLGGQSLALLIFVVGVLIIWACFSKSIRDVLLLPVIAVVRLFCLIPPCSWWLATAAQTNPPPKPDDGKAPPLGFWQQCVINFRTRVNRLTWPHAAGIFAGCLLLLLVMIGLLCLSHHFHFSGNEEPIDISEGVSIWPTIYLRFLAFVLSVVLAIVIYRASVPDSGWLFARYRNQKSQSMPPVKELADDLRSWGFIGSVVGLALIYIILAYLMFYFMGVPPEPLRGMYTKWIDRTVLALAVVSLMSMIFVILLTHHFFRKFILAVGKEEWQGAADQPRLKYPRKIAAEVGRITLVADGTHMLAYMGYFPFIVLAVMILARINYFDNWTFTAPLAVIYLTNTALLVYAVLAIRKDAGRLRQEVLDRLNTGLVAALGHPDKVKTDGEGRQKNKDVYQEAIRYVQNVREGAFRSWLQEPIFESLGGIAGLLILQQMLLPLFL